MSITMVESCLLSQHSLLYTKTKFPIISNSVNPFKLQNPSSSYNNSTTISLALSHITRRRRTRHSSFLTFVAVDEFVNSNPSENLNVFVGNLPDDLALGTLFMLFMEVGNVVGAEINYGDGSNQSFARITMSTFEEVEKAMNKFSGYDLDGKLLTVSREEPIRKKPKPQPSTPRAYDSEFGIGIRNLPRDVDSGRLEEIFSKHGKVESVEIDYNERSNKSIGYLIMANETEMNNAIAALNGQSLDGGVTRLFVYPLMSKESMK